MKSIIYFLLAVLTIVYIGFLCYVNMIGIENLSSVLYYLSIYGGVAIALLYAAINFFGNPLKIVFFILLVVMVILLILTSAMPGVFRSIFKLGNDGKELIEAEIQVRTVAMDFWASLDHKIQYKFEGAVPKEVMEEMYKCSLDIKKLDHRMLDLNMTVNSYQKQ